MKLKKGRVAPQGEVRLTINIDAAFLKRLKIAAIKRGATMTGLILESLKTAGVK